MVFYFFRLISVAEPSTITTLTSLFSKFNVVEVVSFFMAAAISAYTCATVRPFFHGFLLIDCDAELRCGIAYAVIHFGDTVDLF